MSDPVSLTHDEILSRAIGQIQTADVIAEDFARAVYFALANSDAARAAIPRDFARIIKANRRMLGSADLATELLATARDVHTHALKWHKRRVFFIHDRWILDADTERLRSDKSYAIRTLRDRVPDASFEDFVACRNELYRAGQRLRALALILPGELGNVDPLANDEAMRNHWHKVASGSLTTTHRRPARISARSP
jgi:hypothetical protein